MVVVDALNILEDFFYHTISCIDEGVYQGVLHLLRYFKRREYFIVMAKKKTNEMSF
jgi:hypothetical protein